MNPSGTRRTAGAGRWRSLGRRAPWAIALSAALSGCSPYAIREAPLPAVEAGAAFPAADPADTVAPLSDTLRQPWWESFARPGLNTLITQSLANNQRIAQAAAVLDQARALARRSDAQRFPEIGFEGASSKEWEGGDGQPSSTGIGAALAWEVDVFERLGNAALADRLEAVARQEALQTTRLTLSAEVANAWFGAVAANRRIALLRAQLTLDRELLDLLQLRFDYGVGTRVDVMRQQARVADSETLIPLAQSDLAVFENRLDVLSGAMPDGRPRVPVDEALDFAAQLPPLGVPAELLLRRPDLRAARAELVAADAEIAAAIADRLPRVTLDGSLVFSDTASFTGPVALIAGAFVQPLLDWGRRKAEVERNEALYRERLAAFTQQFLEAVEAVDSALVRERRQREFLQRLAHQRDILQQTVDASKDRYTQGVDDYLSVIDALQELRDVERDLIVEQRNLIAIRVDLFRALGGPLPAADDALAIRKQYGLEHVSMGARTTQMNDATK